SPQRYSAVASHTRMSCIQLTIRARNRTTPQYFTCFGRLHVKEALLIIIIGTFLWDTLRWTSFLLQKNVIGDWLEILTEICDAVFGILLFIAYWTESGPLLLPYLFMQLFTLIVSSVLYFICVMTMISVDNPWAIHFRDENSTATDTRLRALFYSLLPLTFSLILIWVVQVLFACYQYFADKRVDRNEFRRRSTASNNQTNGSVIDHTTTRTEIVGISTTIPLDDNSSGQRFVARNEFINENFTLSDEEGENESHIWPQINSLNARSI
uniref:Uncharacterized protein n=3 Tax=Parascaris univalens TaxID=6257 RepID=A0A915C6P3_PARUN